MVEIGQIDEDGHFEINELLRDLKQDPITAKPKVVAPKLVAPKLVPTPIRKAK